MSIRVLPVLVVLALAAAFVGCGGDDDSTGSTGGGETTAAGEESTQETTAEPAPKGAREVEPGPELKVKVPSGPPPKELVIEELETGAGVEAKKGDEIAVMYVGAIYKTGEVFESSWQNGAPIEFPLGTGYVIPGWDQGIVGMKVGGKRQLVIPPALAYGPAGSGPIPPNSTLVFDVELVAVR